MSTGRKVVHARNSGYGLVTNVRRNETPDVVEIIEETSRDHGSTPDRELLLTRLDAAVAAGRLVWSGRRLQVEPPTITATSGTTMAELLVEDRGR